MLTESEKSNQFMLAGLSMSVVLRKKEPFNKSEVIALLVQLASQSVRFDWRNFAPALAARISTGELPLQL